MARAWMALLAMAGAVAGASAAQARSADYYRGGWRTDSGTPQSYEFVIRGTAVTGFACTHCADGTTLAPLEGSFDAEKGLSFTVRHLTPAGATASTDRLTAVYEGGKLIVTGTRGGPGGGAVRMETVKDPRGPTPGAFPVAILPPDARPVPVLKREGRGGGGGPPAPYVRPAPWRQIGAKDVVGVWLGFGTGMDKQYFIIRQDGDRLFGLACGRCDNPYTFGALENFSITGDTLSFDIMHQDWGEGTRLPFVRHVKAQIAMNEMHMDARRDDAPDRPGIVASLVGPIAIEATTGNVIAD